MRARERLRGNRRNEEHLIKNNDRVRFIELSKIRMNTSTSKTGGCVHLCIDITAHGAYIDPMHVKHDRGICPRHFSAMRAIIKNKLKRGN